MQENLVIVESPAKAKTIEKFLGKDYIVKSSFGHIRDLSKKDLGINIDDEFRPVYEIPGDKKKVVDELTKLAKTKTVWLASDEDREGEAIAWHLTEVLGLPVDRTKRIVFHEITKRAILEAIEKPRTVNMDLVNAQQARRILDRLVGFELSPVLWKKVRPALSAGRVQSVAVRLIVEREREIIAFRSAAYFRVVAQFHAASDPEKTALQGRTRRASKRRPRPRHLSRSCIGATFTVSKAEEKPAQRFPAPPVHDLHAPARGRPQAGHVRFADNVRRPAPLRAGSHHLHAYRLGKPLATGTGPVQRGDHQTLRRKIFVVA